MTQLDENDSGKVVASKACEAIPVTFATVVAAPEGAEREHAIDALIARMSAREKVRQMAGSTGIFGLIGMLLSYGRTTYDSGKNRRLGIPPLRFTDGPRGICMNHSTCFPVAMCRGATWDVDLAERTGSALGIEARAQGADFFGGVCINVPRHPGWGRAQETFGEDPCLLGRMGAATVMGVQRHVMACAKHYACNSMEEARFKVDVRIDERTLREVYLPHFKACVDAGVASVMSAYNKVNGDYCGHNEHLLRHILKDEWQFKGLVMSDFMLGVRDGDRSAKAGLDVEMPSRIKYGPLLVHKVKKGTLPTEPIDDSVARVIRQKARFKHVGEPGSYEASTVASPEHVALAREAAEKGIVLLKNEKGALPLDVEELNLLGVIGPLCDVPNIGDMGSSRVHPPSVVTPYQGLKAATEGKMEVMHEIGGRRGRKLESAKHLAREADATVIVVGLDRKDEGEFMPVIHTGGDRADLRLPPQQVALIKAVAAESDRCIVVVEGGSAIVMDEWTNDVEAIMMAWYPGMEGGTAVANIIFGEVNPSGKLPITFPRSNDQNPPFDPKAGSAEYGYYHGYRLFDKEAAVPAFAFGHGLSYTAFEVSDLRLKGELVDSDGVIVVKADVANLAERAGAEVVQLYVGYEGSDVDRPVRELKAFERVELEAGETKTATMELAVEDLAYFDPDRSAWVLEDIDYRVYVGTSSRLSDLGLSATFRVEGIRDAEGGLPARGIAPLP